MECAQVRLINPIANVREVWEDIERILPQLDGLCHENPVTDLDLGREILLTAPGRVRRDAGIRPFRDRAR